METTDTVFDDKILAIAEKIKTLRKEKGFTSHETFAFEHELNRVQYWRVEAGKNITLKTLLRILAIHDLSLEEFFKGL
ncbi:helix-turn-helix transcriptional regulator [Flavobacterium sp. DG1-102-2]|uniref:helix-turn-helix domain-containing protein n=1 Tax=Flavobacterium sp. DG1-102-2 TaxID=3081663 RepID=UPI0029495D55|nr:helix-turn-helix transcriptional regulator [Flavobacterium sp. DG1-102-2]MDV6169372.1 helix-turn-helix transcriptional regulator [Flavobacterium sp. DG1-102-2]